MLEYTNYDHFARAYNLTFGSADSPYPRQALNALEQIALAQVASGSKVLDLACGLGRLAHLLTEAGYRVTGIDGSPQMIEYARENAPHAEFHVADVRDFSLPADYHAVVETGNGLNHLLTVEDLMTVFRNVFSVLLPGGVFAFDFLSEARYETYRPVDWGVATDACAYIMKRRYDPDQRLETIDIPVFYPNDDGTSWSRHDVQYTNRCYSDHEIQGALTNAGFTYIQTYAADDLGITIVSQGTVFYTCRKTEDGKHDG
jgi:ubiquinone/menaquinone biosynthesis C-methylase UbiE